MNTRRDETRKKMLTAASAGFRAHGYAGIGVDGIANAAGVTSGAFYAHLKSKDLAFAAALEIGLDEVLDGIRLFRGEHGAKWLEAFANYYLGKPHRADLSCGCAMASLSPEVARGQGDLHQAYADRMNQIVDRIADGLAGGDYVGRRARAWAFLTGLIGGLTMARAVGEDGPAEEIAAAVRSAALVAAGPAR
ncbi:TetR/AcrR family transcriptional regulator [Nisaea sp.]|uniref:TetR/AcrR family transcriptional regulator n=2 Tax=Nisaea sp. TaxID=2024842 RepID=UPI003298317F